MNSFTIKLHECCNLRLMIQTEYAKRRNKGYYKRVTRQIKLALDLYTIDLATISRPTQYGLIKKYILKVYNLCE